MGAKKGKTTKKTSLGGKIKGAASKLLGGKSKGSRRRSRGPTWYANQILKMKLKKKLWKLKYGGR